MVKETKKDESTRGNLLTRFVLPKETLADSSEWEDFLLWTHAFFYENHAYHFLISEKIRFSETYQQIFEFSLKKKQHDLTNAPFFSFSFWK